MSSVFVRRDVVGFCFRRLTRQHIIGDNIQQLLQGGTSSLLELKSGRLVLPFHGGTGNQWKQ
ncbi:MAG: hypothetical protein P8J37_23295, partial [Fuerstiella sp.]|nr:hypothetical protein [Fuerstiella sp.]